MDLTAAMSLYLWLLAAFVVGLVLYQHIRGTHDLLSLRNIYLFGFIIYQLTSPAQALWRGFTELFTVRDMQAAGFEYCGYTTVYLLLFLWMYTWRRPSLSLASKVPVSNRPLSDGTIMLVALTLMILAIPLRFLLLIPGIVAALQFIAAGFVCVSVGLLGWVWGRRLFNPVVAVFTLTLTAGNAMILLSGAFGRRPLVAVLGALLWGLYYARLRYLPRLQLIVWLLLLSAVPFFIVAKYTAARDQGFKELGAVQIVQTVVTQGSVMEGSANLLSGQLTGDASLWCMENFPEGFSRSPLQSLGYFFYGQIPRKIWPGKPYVLSTKIADMANLQRVDTSRNTGGRGVTLPPGVIGYAEGEGGWYAVFVYAIVFGWVLKFLDSIVQLNAYNPFAVVPIAGSLGNVVGLARGDLAAFAIGTFWAIIGAYLTLLVISMMIGQSSVARYADRRIQGAPRALA